MFVYYVVSKGVIEMFMKIIVLEYVEYGICVNCIVFGVINIFINVEKFFDFE